jgi:hypothetical protein
MNKVLLGIILSVIVIGLGFFTYALDGVRAFSGGRPLFWWFYGSLQYIPLLIVLYLCCLGLKTLWKDE